MNLGVIPWINCLNKEDSNSQQRWKMMVIKNPKQNKFPCAVLNMWLLEDKISSALLWKALLDSHNLSLFPSFTFFLFLPLSVTINCYFRLLLFYFLCTNITSRVNSLTRFPGKWLKTKITLTSRVQIPHSLIPVVSYYLVNTLPLTGRTCPLFLSFFLYHWLPSPPAKGTPEKD